MCRNSNWGVPFGKTLGCGTESNWSYYKGQRAGEEILARNTEGVCKLQLSKYLWMRLLLCLPRKVPVILYSFFKERENAYKSFAVLTVLVLPLKINTVKSLPLVMGLCRNSIFNEFCEPSCSLYWWVGGTFVCALERKQHSPSVSVFTAQIPKGHIVD